ncbi:MAG: M42 family peptidase, partial [Clostridia bacterium]|nr:M42 family peptidase [Clostridia bacterium]
SINPDYALAIDVTATGDTPNCQTNCVKLGCGACIKIMDKSVIASPKMRRALQTCAEENNLRVQNEILSYGGTDAGAIHTVCDGVISGAISIPLRYIHTPNEMVSEIDIDISIELASKFLQKDYLTK